MVTVGALQAGTKENVIPDEAIIKLNVRTFDEGVRKRVLAAIERIVNAEAAASGAPRPPEITPLDRYSLVTQRPGGEPARRRRVPAALLRRARAARPGRRRRARTSGRSAPSGTSRRCSGSSAAPIPQSLREGQGGGPAQRDPDQPQPALRAGHPSDPGDRRGGDGRRRAGLAGACTDRRAADRATGSVRARSSVG